jgi:hypothetical protein
VFACALARLGRRSLCASLDFFVSFCIKAKRKERSFKAKSKNAISSSLRKNEPELFYIPTLDIKKSIIYFCPAVCS